MDNDTKLLLEQTINDFKTRVNESFRKDLSERSIDNSRIYEEISRLRNEFVENVFKKTEESIKEFDAEKIRQIAESYFNENFQFNSENSNQQINIKSEESQTENENLSEDYAEQFEEIIESRNKELFENIKSLHDKFNEYIESKEKESNQIKKTFENIFKLFNIDGNRNKIFSVFKLAEQKDKFDKKSSIRTKTIKDSLAASEEKAKLAQLEEETDLLQNESSEMSDETKKNIEDLQNDLVSKKEALNKSKESSDNEKSDQESSKGIIEDVVGEFSFDNVSKELIPSILSNVSIGTIAKFALGAVAGAFILGIKANTISSLSETIETQKAEEEAQKAKEDISNSTNDFVDSIDTQIDEENSELEAGVEDIQGNISSLLEESESLSKETRFLNDEFEKKEGSDEDKDADEVERESDKENEESENEVKKTETEINTKGNSFADTLGSSTANAREDLLGNANIPNTQNSEQSSITPITSASNVNTSETKETIPTQIDTENEENESDKITITNVNRLILPESSLKQSERKENVINDYKEIKPVERDIPLREIENKDEKQRLTESLEYFKNENPKIAWNIFKNVDTDTISLIAEVDKNTKNKVEELAKVLNDKIDAVASIVQYSQNNIDISGITQSIKELTNLCNNIISRLGA